MNRKPFLLLCELLCLLELLTNHMSYGTDTDLRCLEAIKKSVIGLDSWDLTNKTEGSICGFVGVECWHPDESRVLNLKLQDFDLKGQFPLGIAQCTSLTGLVLSGNRFHGPIPSNISKLLPYVTTLDLSNNNFSGQIPISIANCTFLNTLLLDHNQLSGQIPLQLGGLARLKQFSVASNKLTGQVPLFNASFTGSYVNNPGLCGGPRLPLCLGPPQKSNNGVIVGSVAAGAVLLVVIVMGVVMFYTSRTVRKKMKQDDPEGNVWAKSMKKTKGFKVSVFDNKVAKMSLSDLMNATNSFSNNNIISTGSKGVMYKATLADGSELTVKRLNDSQRSEKEFLSEMKTLGSVKHRNLLSLLGFCMANRERFLVYEYVANGNLFDLLHPVDPEAKPMEWPLRLKIAIGVARGLAWLHHNCNPRIIHRNISSKCILLDGDFEPKLSDFGLARLMNLVDTHLSTFVNGEFGDLGYVAPEYLATLIATPKGDVYSFGTVLLELITGERPTHVENSLASFKGSLVEWISHLSSTCQVFSAIDKSLLGQGFDDELNQFLGVACKCVSSTPKERPTMFEVLQFLKANGERYHFTFDDEIMLPSETNDDVIPHEFIVVQ